jgi:hypothetical protein
VIYREKRFTDLTVLEVASCQVCGEGHRLRQLVANGTTGGWMKAEGRKEKRGG